MTYAWPAIPRRESPCTRLLAINPCLPAPLAASWAPCQPAELITLRRPSTPSFLPPLPPPRSAQIKWKDIATDLNLTPCSLNPERVDDNAGLPFTARILRAVSGTNQDQVRPEALLPRQPPGSPGRTLGQERDPFTGTLPRCPAVTFLAKPPPLPMPLPHSLTP